MAVLSLCSTASGQSEPLAEGEVVVLGAALSIFDDGVANDAQQTVNVGERALVRTCFGVPSDSVACGAIVPGDPRVVGLEVRAELRGPELPTAQPLVGLPGGSLLLPGLQQEGDYWVENIRLVDASGEVVAFSQPSVAVIHVRDIVLASARVRVLSLDELRARGIAFDAENFQAFDFRVGFAFEGEIVEFELPVAYDDFGDPVVLVPPRPVVVGLDPNLQAVVGRWKPPTIRPFVLERPREEKELPSPEELVPIDIPVLGAIVLPGTVTVLNQFFEAQVVLSNGAGEGSGVVLDDLEATIRLPSGALRTEQTEPAATGAAVPLVRGDGSRMLAPGEEGAATWILEGVRAGSHLIRMDLRGRLERPGRDPLPVASVVQAAVDVVDPRFHLTFTHPDVVNEGQPYTLFVTVSNLSGATQNLVTVQLLDQILSGARKADPLDDLRRSIDEIAPGQAVTVEYPLIAEITGRVVASAFEADSSNTSGSIRFVTGVGELGIPLSPATLVLSRYTEHLRPPFVGSDEFLDAQIRFLSLLHGLATAPAAWAPPDLPSANPADVRRRAEDLGEAGQRVFLRDGVLESMEVLLLDLLGNRSRNDADDVLRRATDRGREALEAFAVELRRQQGERSLAASELFRHFVDTTSYAAPYVAAIQETSEPGVLISFATGGDELATTFRSLPYSATLPVSASASGGDTSAELIVVGRLVDWEGDGTGLALRIQNLDAVARSASLEIVIPSPSGPELHDFGSFVVPAGADWTLPLERLRAGHGWLDAVSGAGVVGPSAFASAVALPPFQILGAVQEFRFGTETFNVENPRVAGNIYGNGVLFLFNRPPGDSIRELAESFRITASFDGLDTAGAPATLVLEKPGAAVYVQPSERVVAVRFSQPISALQDAGADLVDHVLHLDSSIADRDGSPVQGPWPELIVEKAPQHAGGLVAGQVVRGDGTPVEGARVRLLRTYRPPENSLQMPGRTTVGEVVTGVDGRYAFDFVESPSWDRRVLSRATLLAEIPEGPDPALEPATTQEVGVQIRLLNRLHRLNIALIGRGAVEGSVRYDDGTPVSCDAVLGCPSILAFNAVFQEPFTGPVEPDGTFRIGGLPVGPVTMRVIDRDGRTGFDTVLLSRPGEVVVAEIVIPRAPPRGTGEVVVRVEGREFGTDAVFPVEGARIAVYSEGDLIDQAASGPGGVAVFPEVPEGRVTVQAADFSISRSTAITSFDLRSGEARDVAVLLESAPGRTVFGRVLYDDPFTGVSVPVVGALVETAAAGRATVTDADGNYRFEDLPVQGVLDPNYSVRAVDLERGVEGSVQLPPILPTSPDTIEAQPIVFAGTPTGTIDGIVLDEYGRPVSGATIYFKRQLPNDDTGPPAVSAADGTFSIPNIRLAHHQLIAAIGTGFSPWPMGAFGEATVQLAYAGQRAFVTLRLAGAGTLRIKTRTAGGPSQALVFYRPTYFSLGAVEITLRGAAVETSSDPNGDLLLPMPVGAFQVVAYGPFSGTLDVSGRVEYPGQIVDLDLEFPLSSTVEGTLLDVDGVTPIPNAGVTMKAGRLLPRDQTTDALGRFRFELVPEGPVVLESETVVGSVLRFASLLLPNVGPATTADVALVLKAQGSVAGRVFRDVGGGVLEPVLGAEVRLREGSDPRRRVPAAQGTYLSTDSEGRYEVSGLVAGPIQVDARDPLLPGSGGRATVVIETDWQVVAVPDIVLSQAVGEIRVLVRDPESGAAVPDALVTLDGEFTTVAGGDGIAVFAAVPLGVHRASAFDPPTARSGRVDGLRLDLPGQILNSTATLDQRGEVRGTLYDTPSFDVPIGGASVRLSGNSTSGQALRAFANTAFGDSAGFGRGRFDFPGIPEGTYRLDVVAPDSPRRAAANVDLTPTAPIADLALVLEAAGDVYFRLFELLSSGPVALLPDGLLSVRVQQSRNSVGTTAAYDVVNSTPVPGTDVLLFPDVLLERRADVFVEETGGELRTSRALGTRLDDSSTLPGAGTLADPFRLTLGPKGVVRVRVRDAEGSAAVSALVTVRTSAGPLPGVTGATGEVTFFGVPAGTITAEATAATGPSGGSASGQIVFDDDALDLMIDLAPAVRASGVVYEPVPDDRVGGGPPIPAEGIVVQLDHAFLPARTTITDAQGRYTFEALLEGAFTVDARSDDGARIGSFAGVLVGPDGFLNALPPLTLDGSAPRVLSIAPAPGAEGVSRSAAVEVLFSELLDPLRLPPTNNGIFSLRDASGASANGVWSSTGDGAGRQVVRFEPSSPLQNDALYSLSIAGGSGGVRDRVGRPLTDVGSVGSSFRTSDTVGPSILGIEPDLSLPVPPTASLRVDFSEAVVASGSGAIAELFWLDGTGVERVVPTAVSRTRQNFSVRIDPLPGLDAPGDTGRRRLLIANLEDGRGNPVAPESFDFRIHDGRPPRITGLAVPGVTDGAVPQGAEVRVVPVLADLDETIGDALPGDLARVDYFLEDPGTGEAVGPVASGTSGDFAFEFVAAYLGDGTTPRTFPVWARAVDTSSNSSNVAFVDLEILPNVPPRIDAVEITVVRPPSGAPYRGATVRIDLLGLDDSDASELTVRAEIADAFGAVLDAEPGVLVQRPTGGWAELAAPTFELEIPESVAVDALVVARGVVVDSAGAESVAETSLAVVADELPPRVTSLRTQRTDGMPSMDFRLGESFLVLIEGEDDETRVAAARVEFDRTDLFPASVEASAVPGFPGRFQTQPIVVPIIGGPEDVVVTARLTDLDGNTANAAATIRLVPEADPEDPTITWRTPWREQPGTLWPAGHTSPSGSGGTMILLRAEIVDRSRDGDGVLVPGALALVEFYGPEVDGGALVLSSSPVEATVVPGTAAPGRGLYEAVWRVPDGLPAGALVPFEARAVDTGGRSVSVPVALRAVPPRQVYEGTEGAVLPGDDMLGVGGDPSGPVFLLDGATVSVFPAEEGGLPSGARMLESLVVLAGGEADVAGWTVAPTALTVPEVTSRVSAVTHYPLDLRLDGVLQVGQAAAIDLDGRGLRGNTTEAFQTVEGAAASQPLAGGSHGGLGWRGRIEDGSLPWEGIPFQRPGEIYGNVRDPRDPGSGGTGITSQEQDRGGSGGGVFVLGGDAEIVVEGEITARGTAAPGTRTAGSGAGGSLDLRGRRLLGRGTIDASGGAANSESAEGSGGGGRIALAAQDVAGELTVRAHGARNSNGDAPRRRTAGAGTVVYEELDGAGAVVATRLLLDNPESDPVAITPLPALGEGAVESVDAELQIVQARLPGARGSFVGELAVIEGPGGPWTGRVMRQTRGTPDTSGELLELGVDLAVDEWSEVEAALPSGLTLRGRWTFDELVLGGATWLSASDELEVAGALDDPTSVGIGAEARLGLRADRPQWSVGAIPASGETVRPGALITMTGGVSHSLGVDLLELRRSDLPGSEVERLADFPVAVDLGSLGGLSNILVVPYDAAPGQLDVTWSAHDADGRGGSQSLSWEVLPNEPPALVLTASPGDPPSVVAGFDISVRVDASDVEGLDRVVLDIVGPVLGPTQRSGVLSGTSAGLEFIIPTRLDADGTEPVQLTATVVDRAGATTEAVLAVGVEPNRETRITWDLAPGASREIRPGTSTTLQLEVEDLDGLTSVTMDAVGAVETAQEVRSLAGSSASEQFIIVARPDAPVGEVLASVQVTDEVGMTASAGPLVLEIVENLSPTGALRLTSGPQSETLPGATLPVEVAVEDDEGLARIDLRLVGALEGAPATISRPVAGTTATEHFEVFVARRALAGQEVRIEAEVTDLFGTTVALGPLVLTVLPDIDPPEITLSDMPDSVRAGSELSATIGLTDAVGVERLTIAFDGETTEIDEPGSTFVWRVAVPSDLASTRTADFEVRATDYTGNQSASALRSIELLTDAPPTVQITGARPASPVLPGTTLEIDLVASDDVGVERLELAVLDAAGGAEIASSTFPEQGPSVMRTVSVPLPTMLPADLEVRARVVDGLGREDETVVAMTTMLDVTAPTVRLESFPEDNSVVSGDQLTFVVRATDDVGVAASRLLIEGAQVEVGGHYVSYVWDAPLVAAETAFLIRAEAEDYSVPLNIGIAEHTLTVRPNARSQAPTIEFECPSSGALLPEGYTVTLQLRASDDEAVQRIELYEGSATLPFAQIDGSATSAELLGTSSFVLTPSALDRHELRAVAFDFAGNSSETTIEIHTTAGAIDLFDDAAVVAGAVNDWSALESEVVVLRGGLLTLDAPRRFGGLLLLDGATLTHPAWSSATQPTVDLQIDGPFTVECGAGVDVTGRGYPQAVNYPDVAPATGTEHGGSHLGGGGIGTGSGRSGETFGSVYWPEEAGGAGISGSGRGGGVVVIGAQTAVVDGGLVADGAGAPGSFDTGGAGGTVRLDVSADLRGQGVLQAKGGDARVTDRGSGGGGSIAVLHGGSNHALDLQIDAAGSSFGRAGGAGTVYRFDGASLYGALLVDNAPQTVVSRSTVLPALGGGAVVSFDGTWLELDRPPAIPQFFVNHFVRLGGGSEVLGEWRVLEVLGSRVRLDAPAGALVDVAAGTQWQGVYLFDSLEVSNGAYLESSDPIEISGSHVIRGIVEARRIVAGELVLESGAVLRHPFPESGETERLEIDVVGAVVIEPGASIDVSGRGYGAGQTYPGVALPTNTENGGSHLGEGGVFGNFAGGTYGSVVRPREPGQQGTSAGGRGGGVLRLRSGSLHLAGATSAIRANGADAVGSFDTGGAGGSVWITVSGEISGQGVVEARGGSSRVTDRGSGGGGAIAIEYGSSSGSVLDDASAAGGAFGRTGAAGSVHLRRADQLYGDLVIDNGSPGSTQRWTRLPSLGAGVAVAGSGGAILETGLADVADFFVGHWVEVRRPDGPLRGRWRIVSITGGRLQLEAPHGGAVEVEEGDTWRGLHLYDGLRTDGEVRLVSDDLLEFAGEIHIDGEVAMRSLIGLNDLVVAAGATLHHPLPTPGTVERLEIDVLGAVLVESGAAIDVSGRGYGQGEAHPGTELPADGENGGSHLGEGGVFRNAPGRTYGSIVRPQEPGTQGTSFGGRGGGVLRLEAESLNLLDATSAVRANGGNALGSFDTGGAGGSIWISVSEGIVGDGTIEARGGVSRVADRGSGGGGAVAIEYGSASGSVLGGVSAAGGAFGRTGAAGTVLLRRADQLYGDLVVDNGSPGATDRWTRLPSLGSGLAGPASGGVALDTGQAEISEDFVAHWVEVRDSGGEVRGRWRIREVNGGVLGLEALEGGPVTVVPGDSWRGLHRFDGLRTGGQVRLVSDDLIEFAEVVHISGDVAMRTVVGEDDLVVEEGARLRHPMPQAGGVERLEIDVAGTVWIESEASIDVSARGYGPGEPYPGVALPADSENGGSHLGEGGVFRNAPGATYGSVARPQEPGTQGASSGGRGGGVVRLQAESLHFAAATSSIRANGGNAIGSLDTGGAGGSIWIRLTGEVGGSGIIEARGGDARIADRGAGGGGAVSIEYGSVAGIVLDGTSAAGGEIGRSGGAGTVLLRRTDRLYGDLVVDNGGVATLQSTVLPALGSGVALPGSSGAVLVVDPAIALHPFFVGHWIELSDGDGTLLGTHRIVEVDPSSSTIRLDEAGAPTAIEGLLWQGVYRFDSQTVGPEVTLRSDDPVRMEGGG